MEIIHQNQGGLAATVITLNGRTLWAGILLQAPEAQGSTQLPVKAKVMQRSATLSDLGLGPSILLVSTLTGTWTTFSLSCLCLTRVLNQFYLQLGVILLEAKLPLLRRNG